MSKSLTFRTASQAALWEHELLGQISDGHWENFSSPRDHWEYWCRSHRDPIHVLVGADVGRDFFVRYDRYNLCSKDLLEVVEQRMLGYARLALAGVDKAGISVLDVLFGCDGWVGMPTYEGEYWDKQRDAVVTWLTAEGYSLDEVKCIVTGVRVSPDAPDYGSKELRADLREMKKIIRWDKSRGRMEAA